MNIPEEIACSRELWGKRYDEIMSYNDVEELIEDIIDSEEMCTGEFDIVAANAPHNHFSQLFADNSAADDILHEVYFADEDDPFVESAWFAEMLSERYDTLMETNFEYCDPHETSVKLDKGMARVFNREMRRYAPAAAADDEQSMLYAAGRLRRRMRRLLRHLPFQNHGVVDNELYYILTVRDGKFVSIVPDNGGRIA